MMNVYMVAGRGEGFILVCLSFKQLFFFFVVAYVLYICRSSFHETRCGTDRLRDS
jgi:ATP/ADP translocase